MTSIGWLDHIAYTLKKDRQKKEIEMDIFQSPSWLAKLNNNNNKNNNNTNKNSGHLQEIFPSLSWSAKLNISSISSSITGTGRFLIISFNTNFSPFSFPIDQVLLWGLIQNQMHKILNHKYNTQNGGGSCHVA